MKCVCVSQDVCEGKMALKRQIMWSRRLRHLTKVPQTLNMTPNSQGEQSFILLLYVFLCLHVVKGLIKDELFIAYCSLSILRFVPLKFGKECAQEDPQHCRPKDLYSNRHRLISFRLHSFRFGFGHVTFISISKRKKKILINTGWGNIWTLCKPYWCFPISILHWTLINQHVYSHTYPSSNTHGKQLGHVVVSALLTVSCQVVFYMSG